MYPLQEALKHFFSFGLNSNQSRQNQGVITKTKVKKGGEYINFKVEKYNPEILADN